MVQYAIFKNEAEYNVWQDKVSQQLNLPQVNMRGSDNELQPLKQQTVRYNECIAHPDDKENRVIAIIDEICPENLKVDLTFKTKSEAESLGWFPVVKENGT